MHADRTTSGPAAAGIHVSIRVCRPAMEADRGAARLRRRGAAQGRPAVRRVAPGRPLTTGISSSVAVGSAPPDSRVAPRASATSDSPAPDGKQVRRTDALFVGRANGGPLAARRPHARRCGCRLGDPGIGPLVLVVDDETAARSAVCRMARGLGYRVQSCDSGREALRYLEAHPVRSSCSWPTSTCRAWMGGTSGAGAGSRSRRSGGAHGRGRRRPSVEELLTGYRDLPVLTKPVGFAELYGRLRDLLGPPAMSLGRAQALRSSVGTLPSGRHGFAERRPRAGPSSIRSG